MSLASPVKASWSYDFGEYTGSALGAQAAVSINAAIATARAQAVTMIASGNYGPTNGVYRVIVRADALVPQGFSVEVRQVTS
jgi:uncharacterized protein with FMN-binding domain